MKKLAVTALSLLLAAMAWGEEPQSKRLRHLNFDPFRVELASFSPEESGRVGRMVKGATIPQIQEKLSSGQLTSEQLTLYFLASIRRQDEHLRGYIEINPQALLEARAADRLRSSGTVLGPMHGIPVNLKDNINTTAPMHTSGGAEILLDFIPSHDAVLVRQLRQSGAVILGKASLSELAGAITTKPPGSNAVSGKGVNPYRADLPVLGSSSGSGITTSAYETMVSIGTETSGSLIAPATFNGVVGMKPSLNLVSGEGVIPLIHFQDSPGPVARSVTDAAILLDVIDGSNVDYLRALRTDALKNVKVGLLPEVVQAGPHKDPIQAGLSKTGAVSLKISQPLKGMSLIESLVLALGYDTVPYLAQCGAPVHSVKELQKYNQARPSRRVPFGQDFVDICAAATGELLRDNGVAESDAPNFYQKMALANRDKASDILNQTFAQAGVEVLVSHSNLASEYYATAGYPAITVPLGRDATGAPIGVTFIGKQGQDAALLSYAYAFEQATKLRVDP